MHVQESVEIGGGTANRRVLHWVVAVAFFLLLTTGLVIYLPALAGLASGGWTRLLHRVGAVLLIGAPLAYALIKREAASQWLRGIAVWRKAHRGPHFVNRWKRSHKLLISLGYFLLVLTGGMQWFLKGVVPSSAFNVSIFVHDILFFSAIVLLLYHVYFEFSWWQWKRKNCRYCGFPYCAGACPIEAITGGNGKAIARDQRSCNNCRMCMEYCLTANLSSAAKQSTSSNRKPMLVISNPPRSAARPP